MSADGVTTVAELVEFIDRARMALTEAGRPDLAEHAHVAVLPDGRIRLSFRRPEHTPTTSDPAVEKFLTIDPMFEKDDQGTGR